MTLEINCMVLLAHVGECERICTFTVFPLCAVAAIKELVPLRWWLLTVKAIVLAAAGR